MKDRRLWEDIAAFQFDDSDAELPFSRRLARDNNWGHGFALRCITEYKKFIYLCCTSEHSVTPSDAVDQVWHLHLTYTRSYWEDLCHAVCGRQIHHNPTKGGNLEKLHFMNCYNQTLKLYESEFGEKPPHDVWLATRNRFSAVNFSRVDKDSFWLIKKPSPFYRRLFAVSAGCLLTIWFFINSETTSPWAALFVIGIVAFLVINIIKNGHGGGKSGGSGCSAGCGGCSGCSGCSGCGGCGD